MGLVASYNRPGGNVTGIAVLIDVLGAKRLGLLREVVPTATLIAVLLNPTEPNFDTQLNDVQDAARARRTANRCLARKHRTRDRRSFRDGDGGPSRSDARRHQFFLHPPARATGRTRGARCAADDLRPARIHVRRRADELCHRSCGCVSSGRHLHGQVLEGARPSDLPVVQSTKFELVLNLKTAKALGLTIPPTLLARADEVIE